MIYPSDVRMEIHLYLAIAVEPSQRLGLMTIIRALYSPALPQGRSLAVNMPNNAPINMPNGRNIPYSPSIAATFPAVGAPWMETDDG